MLPVVDDAVQQGLDSLPRGRNSSYYRGLPLRLGFLHGEHAPDIGDDQFGAREIRLVYDEDVPYLHDAGLQGLDLVAHHGGEDDDHGLGDPDDLHLGLARPHGLHDDVVLPRRVQDPHHVPRRPRHAAVAAPSRHAADEDPVVGAEALHAHPVPQEGPA